MNRLAFNTIVRVARVNPATRSLAPYRWQSSTTGTTQAGKGASQAIPGTPKTATNQTGQGSSQGATKPGATQAIPDKTKSTGGNQSGSGSGSNGTAFLAGGLTVLVGGLAWYHLSGTRQVACAAQEGAKKAQELKEQFKKAGEAAADAGESLKHLRSATVALIPGSAPFLGKIFDEIEKISKDHGDDVKKIFHETYNDLEKLAKEGSLDPKTAGKAVEILQKRVKEIREIAGDAGGEAFNKLVSDNPELRDKVSDQYKNLKDLVEKAKEKKPEVQKLVKETGSELVEIFKDGVSKQSIKKAQDLLKKKGEEAKKLLEENKKK